MKKKADRLKTAREGMLAGLAIGHAQSETDRRLSAKSERDRAVALLDADSIRPRNADMRPPRAAHVLALAESVAAVGLLQALAVDRTHRLIAGLHRLEACRLLLLNPEARVARLKELEGGSAPGLAERCAELPIASKLAEPLRGGQIPCRVLTGLDAEADPDSALAAEAAENTARRNYTPSEIESVTERLRAAGYVETKGRPHKGTKALRPALELVLGVSKETAQRYLGRRPGFQKGGQMTTFSDACNRLHGSLKAFTKASTEAKNTDQHRIVKAARELEALLDKELKHHDRSKAT